MRDVSSPTERHAATRSTTWRVFILGHVKGQSPPQHLYISTVGLWYCSVSCSHYTSSHTLQSAHALSLNQPEPGPENTKKKTMTLDVNVYVTCVICRISGRCRGITRVSRQRRSLSRILICKAIGVEALTCQRSAKMDKGALKGFFCISPGDELRLD